VDARSERGIAVTNMPDALTTAPARLTRTLILAGAVEPPPALTIF
jgi:lactate dehydrogenase-like 2-hydroxyacid dehydrogenase